MQSNRLRPLRILLVVILVLLGFQYELGMAVNIANPNAISPFQFSLSAVSEALHGVGIVAVLHAGLGGLLLLLSVIGLVLSLVSRVRGAQIFGALGFLCIVLAASGGLLFVLSGFQNDNHSHQMASMFLLSFTFYFLEVYALKE